MFECEYCKTKFLTEVNFNDHECSEEVRIKELNTRRGLKAFSYYREWFSTRKLKTPNKDTFVVSRTYKTFFTFADFAKEMGIPDTTLYIKFMVSNSIMPAHWYNADIYEYFMNYFDNQCEPATHVRITLAAIERIARGLDCKMGDIFDHLDPSDVIKLIQARHLSPWMLLFSKKFAEFLKNDVTREQRTLIEEVIKLDRWKIIFETNRSHIPKIKEYLAQLDL